VAVGLTALAAANGIYAPATGFHQDAIRIPMLAIGALGAFINLAVLLRVWSLRARASATWRRRTLSKKEQRSERLQLAMAILTLVLVGLELWTHPMVHRTGPRPSSAPAAVSH
jgi:formate hydrogenlyase subunit 3/multisubunit Na+/H+ antiporter MnhD subunit